MFKKAKKRLEDILGNSGLPPKIEFKDFNDERSFVFVETSFGVPYELLTVSPLAWTCHRNGVYVLRCFDKGSMVIYPSTHGKGLL